MKKIFKSITIITFVMIISFCFTACSGGISKDEAKTYINSFFDAIESKDYDEAETFLHPERPADLKAYFELLEKEAGLDFSSIEIDKYTGFSSSYYDSSVGGSAYSLDMDVIVDGDEVEIEIEIVKNDNGYGIYNLDIDTD